MTINIIQDNNPSYQERTKCNCEIKAVPLLSTSKRAPSSFTPSRYIFHAVCGETLDYAGGSAHGSIPSPAEAADACIRKTLGRLRITQ